MWTHVKLLAALILTTFFCSCNGTDKRKADDGKSSDIFKGSLREKQIGKSNYYISLPSDYSIKETDGEDFSVYYFSPTDTTARVNFAGGLYFGNIPHEFETGGDSCKTTTSKDSILGNTADWTIYNCNGNYSLQTIIDSKSGEEWNEKIHAFGNATSDTDIRKVLDIYTTLRQGKK